MLTSLQIKNFRLLKDFQVEKLGRLNLIVGKNNSGKSSVLEALRIFAANGRPSVLKEIAQSHDEKTTWSTDDVGEFEGVLRYQHFFTGRVFPSNENQAIVIGEINSADALRMEHAFYVEREETVTESDGEIRTETRRKRVRRSQLDTVQDGRLLQALVVTVNGRALPMFLQRPRTGGNALASMLFGSGRIPCSYVPTQFESMDKIASEWDRIALSSKADLVKDALRIVAPEVDDLVFVNKSNAVDSDDASTESKRTAKVKLRNVEHPVPLNSMGDGMLRILHLILKVFSAANGYLLIDEFENGLHYSVQEKVWRLLFTLAKDLNIQIFATTHSWDCIESFTKVAVEREDIEGVLFRVGRSIRTSDSGNVIATVFDEAKLANLTQADVEVR